MASNIIAPQPLPSSVALTEDLIKMFTQPHATVLNELVEKDPAALKRAFPQVFSQNEPPGKRAPPPFQLPQMQNNLTNLTQQQLLQHQVMQQALSRGTMPANFTLPGNIPLSMASVPPHIDLDKIRKEQQQQLHQQQIQQQAQQLQQQQQQQLQQLQQQQMYQQQQQHQLQILQQHQRAMQQQQQQQQSLQQIQQLPAGQAAVRAGMMDLRNQQPPMDYSTLLRMQLAQNAQTAQNQALQAQMPPRRQTISTATLPQSVSSLKAVGEVRHMANAIPRLHRPSPQLLPNTSPILSTSAPVGPAAVPTPKVQTFMQPIVPTRSPVAVPAIPTTTRGPDEADFVKFIHNVRQVEQQYHNLLGDGMVRLPSSSSKE